MRVLLDTHTLIWAVDDPDRLGPAAVTVLRDPANELMASAASVWEIAIKVGLGKLTLAGPYRVWMNQALVALGATLLPVTVEYADAQVRLPDHHRDPFDRLLVARAIVEAIPLVSADRTFDRYGIPRIESGKAAGLRLPRFRPGLRMWTCETARSVPAVGGGRS